ncbi:uncharacterized protein LOC123544865 [Mercenaria mercenaria]|uniref:uncharacterized protein LOC123544865 n=1 Tax=Mercenaria mercenaria TaxID=6596 RepID=UPI00234F7200|nr:uncharacterized protein LOC123544865 [Mercenaria mercenaria]
MDNGNGFLPKHLLRVMSYTPFSRVYSGIYAGYCTEYYDCTKTCQRVVRTTTSSWIFWEATKYRTENYDCPGTCSRDVCCSGYTGNFCTTDIDECSDGTKCSQNCVNTYGSYRCSCNNGYSLLSDGYSCQDQDECSSWNYWSWDNGHNCAHLCTNTPGSYSCTCYNGYRLLTDGYSCQDLDECGEGTSGCEHSCTNTEGSFGCSCNHGYELSSDGRSCQDINECSRGTSGCQHNCINTVGSFACSCNMGFLLNMNEKSCADVDECGEGIPGCEHSCTNTEGSFECSCNNGYELSSDGRSCQDINECLRGTSGCQHNCINTGGSFACSCNIGFLLNMNEKSCADIDECADGSAECEVHCENTVGSYTCGCNLGFILTTNDLNCEDIDECSESNGGCAQTCVNEPGSYNCACIEGFQLDMDGQTCFDIDECEQSIAGCSQSCANTFGSYLCSCDTGYELETDLHTCSDINECLLLNGGCQEVCTNSEGTFECACFDGSMLQEDGFTCPRGKLYQVHALSKSGKCYILQHYRRRIELLIYMNILYIVDDTKGTVFERYNIVGSLLPEACFSLAVAQCTDGVDNDLILKSTLKWYQQKEQPSVFYTLGITFVEMSTMSLPLSLRGLKVVISEADCSFSYNIISSSSDDNVFESGDSSQDCRTFNLTDLDMYDFLSHGSFLRTYLVSLSTSLPNWIDFDKSSDSAVEIHDVKSDIIYGDTMKDTDWCNGAPVIHDHLYNVFRFDTVFSLSVLGEDVKIPLPAKGNKFCIIVDLSYHNESSFFLMIPEQSRSFLESINIFKQLKQKYGLRVLPRGIGLSVVSSYSTELELWNGDTMFKYPLDLLSPADVWVGGDISIDGNYWTIDGSVDMYLGVPNLETMLSSVYLDEWNAYALVRMSPSLKFRLFGKYFEVDLEKSVNAEVEAYVSIGGKQRSWCGETSNPPGIFFTVQMELATPFEGVPFLGDWHSSLRQKAYVFSTYEPSLVPSEINIKSYILNLETSVDNIIELMTLEFQDLNDGISFKNTTVTTVNDILPILTSLKELIQNIKADLDTETFEDIKPLLDKVWILFTEMKHQTTLFFYDTEFIEKEQFSNFENDINNEIDAFKVEISRLLTNVTNTLMKEATSFSSFGIKYTVNLIVKTVQLGEFDIEMVYSTDSLFKCSRFGKVMEHLRGEQAMRILGRASVQKKLNNFFSYEKGIGIGAALSVNTDKFVFQLQLFAKLLGMKATGDLFLTNNGLYLYLEGNIWDIFLAQLDVSAEIGGNWYDLVIRVQGRFVAKARKKRQIQTVSSSFEDSYFDALKKLITIIADGAQRRLNQAQDGLTSAQNKLTEAQLWIRNKQENVNSAYAAFDKAVASLEIAKVKLEAAKGPFEEALEKLRNAQRNVDNLCRIKSCDSICVLPQLKCKTCWKGWIPYPCCSKTGCLISIPDPICVAANVACRIVRGVAYALLEAAKIFVRLPMLALDAAKVVVSVAQVIVDKSRVAVVVAEGLLELAHTGLELAKGVLEAAKLVLEGVKYALGAAVNVLTFVIEFGIQSIIDVKNCGFDVEISTKDLPVFSVFCDVNAFKLGWKTISIKINFKNILQSIWNAARATIDLLMKQIGNVFGIGRKRREITFRASAKVHASILRTIREVGSEDTYLNESIDISNNISGMGTNIEEDYASRVLLFNEKCKKMTVVIDFMQVAFESLQDIVNESMLSIDEISSLIDELQQFTTTGLADNMTLENLGISKEHAENDYNMTDDDFEKLMENITQAIENDLLLTEISTVANVSIENMAEIKESIESINFLDSWFVAMANTSKDYFNATECFDFKDCVFYSISTLYDLYEAEDIPDIDSIRTSIIDLEAVLIELFQNETHAISDISIALDSVTSNVTYLSDANPFCSLAPTFVSDLKNQTVLNSTDVVFTCDATGDPFPQFWWLKNDEYLTNEQSMQMTVSSATPDDSGIYTCIAGNVVANITSNEAHLLVVMHDENECGTRNGNCGHICTNIIGSFKCSCREGYTLNGDKSTCTDIDECAGWTTCSQNCVNTYGSYRCSCNTGYSLLTDGYTCQDRNECSGWNDCDHWCTNTAGSYTCSCYTGYTLLADRSSCTDMNECAEGTSGCDHSCTNTEGSFLCSCNHGFELSFNGRSCRDVNECSRGTSGCQHYCINTVGSFACSCYSGFQLDLNGKSCLDVDECVDGSEDCAVYCQNTVGSYTCGCDTGYVLTENGLGCEDVDECSENNAGCIQTCVNEPGSYHCECSDGFQLDTDEQSCTDIDECGRGISGCTQNCDNTVGSYVCSCDTGYEIESDLHTCSDIDDCIGVVCQHVGTCRDGLNSYSCLCSPSFTSAHCETDINECLIHNGGCQEVCTNTEGSYECECYDGRELQTDGYSCPRDGEYGTVFEQYKIGGFLLPEACFSLSVTQCTGGTNSNMKLKSTSEWYRLREQPSVFYTFGIAFVENNVMALPASLQGLAITLAERECRISNIVSYKPDDGNLLFSEEPQNDCKVLNLTGSDIFDFISHESFLRTYLSFLSPSLPNWIKFGTSSDSVLSIQDLKSEILYGDEIKDTAWCNEAPVLDDHIYNVFRFDSNISLSILGHAIKLPLPSKGNKFCIIVGLGQNSRGSFFLMIPEESRSIFDNINIFQQLKAKYGLSVLPRGIGLSVVSSHSSELKLWNGDAMFQYPLDFLSHADVWLGGEISINGNFWTIDGNADIFFGVPDVETVLTSIFLEEWNAYARVTMSPSLNFKVFGQDYKISLAKSINAEVETYASIGGNNRTWCGETSNPPGIFFTVQMELATPFEGVPILEDWHSSIRQKAYVFATSEPSRTSAEINTSASILNLDNHIVKILDLMNTEFQALENFLIFRNRTQTLADDILQIVMSIKDLIQNCLTEQESGKFDDIKPLLDQIWALSFELERLITLFFYDTEFIEQELFANFETSLTLEIDAFKYEISNVLSRVSNTLIQKATSFTGFGLKYTVNLVVKGAELGEFDIEIVYSADSLLKCSRFDKVKEHLEGEQAFRLLGRASYKKKLNNFFSYEKGIGVGAALSVTSNKFVFQLQLFAKLLGMKATGDLFLTNNGLYLYIEGNIWDIFLAQLDVSAENGKNWYDLVIRVQGKFVAKARKKRQIQTESSSFKDSYLNGLKKVINVIADYANKRIDQGKQGLTNAQYQFSKAQEWLEDKQIKLDNAHAVFDTAVASLETAKVKLEEAKKPFEEALEKLRNAQKNIDNLCKIKSCSSICVPGIECEIRWKKVWFVTIPYPWCWLSNCMLRIPDPICELANIACRIVRGIAYLALEAAKLFVRLPMIAFDIAKAAVSLAQVIVDKSRVAIDLAAGLFELAQKGLEFAKGVLEAAKFVLDGVKFALGAAVNVLEFVIEFGLKSIIDVKNCGFDVEISTKDLPVFAVFCDINAFKLGWKTITIKVNFKNIFQSIWNAARATIDVLMKQISSIFGIGRKRREIAFRSVAKIHEGLLRTIREVGIEETFLNESIDISDTIIGMGTNIDEDYDNRVHLFNVKCQKMTVVMDFMEAAFESLRDIVNESMFSINEISSVIDELQQYTTTGLAENMTLENLGISKEHAGNDYNMTDEDFEKLMENITEALENDLLLLKISSAANFSMGNLAEMIESIEAINFLDSWFVAMANTTTEYFNSTECFDFKDCVLYSIATLYELYEAEDVPDIDNIRTAILDLEAVLIELFQNETHAISDISIAMDSVTANVTYLSDANPFCSLAPAFVSDLKNQTVLNSTDIVFTCNATGDPFPQFWWLKNEEYLTDEHLMQLTISSATPDNSGIYTCIAGNVVANITSNEAHLLVVMHDENECETRNGDCGHICTNVIGSFECSCHQGYTLNEDKSTCTRDSKEDEIAEDEEIMNIALFASGALFVTTAIAVTAFIVYTKLSKAKVLPNTLDIDVKESVQTEKNLSDGPVVEVEERSFGPVKTSFNKRVFTIKVVPVK